MHHEIMPPDYFVSPVPTLWTIDSEGEAIEWTDSQSTALMMPHLDLICRALAEQLKGLPSLTAILFTVDALRNGWSLGLAEQRLEQLVKVAGDQSSAKFMLPHLVKWLHSLQSLDSEFRQGPAAHIAFLSELCEQLPREWLETDELQTSQTLQWLENVLGDRGNLLLTRLKGESTAAARTLNVLDYFSIQGFTAEGLQLRMRTGLDRLPTGQALEIIDRFPVASLAKQLTNLSDELGVIARMAQALSATLSLPRSPSDPDVLPIGGVSDVANRGQPDRLLMSELAMDSDLLIARIANGQALYLRREQPPQPQSKHRCLMIETGVRTWGTMRLYTAAFALGLCIAMERRGDERLDVVSVAGDSAWLEELNHRSGLMRFYERLFPDVHPGQALMDLANRKNLELDLTNQPILVLSEATDGDAEFRRVIQDFPKPHMVARIERTGWVELIERSSVGEQSLQRLRLEITATSDPKSKVTKSQSTDKIMAGQDSLPGFLKLQPCPLRFSTVLSGPCVQGYAYPEHSGCWVLTHDRRIMLLDDIARGACEVGYAPSGRVLASHVPKHNSWLLVIESTPHMSKAPLHWLVKVDFKRGVTLRELKVDDEKPHQLTYCFDQSELLRIGKNLTFFDPRNGSKLASAPCQHPHLGGLFFGVDSVYVAMLQGDTIKWHNLGHVPSPAGSVARSKLGMPVVYARDLSWMLPLTGDSPRPQATGVQIQTAYPPRLLRVSGTRCEMLVSLSGVTASTDPSLICSNGEKINVYLSLTEPKVTFAGFQSADRLAAFDAGQHALFYQYQSVRTRIFGISFHDGRLIVHTRGARYAVEGTSIPQAVGKREVLALGWYRVEESAAHSKMFTFGKPIQRAGGAFSRWKLRHVRLPNGDAWLDSRGLLHLRAVDGSELSLMLATGHLAGWHSSLQVFGPNYFVDGTENTMEISHQNISWLTDFANQQL